MTADGWKETPNSLNRKTTSRISSTKCEDVKMIFVSQMSALLYTTTI